MSRLKILSEDSLNSLYEIPKLTEEDRQNIFALDEADQNYLGQLNSIPVKVNYILHLGYFRIAQYFFTFTFQKVREDAWFILKTYFPGSKFPKKQIGSRQYYANRQFILQKYGMILYSKSFEEKLSKYLEQVVKQHAAPRYLFDAALDYCHQRKVIRPSYFILQELISGSLQTERKRLSNKLYRLMDDKLRQDLDKLLAKKDLFYQITLIKRDQKNFTTHEIRSSVEKNRLLVDIYKKTDQIIKSLDISEQNVSYYAELALQYSAYDLKELKRSNLIRLYLLCYVHHRFLKINDYLIASFIHRLNEYVNNADEYQKEMIYQAQMSDCHNRNLAADILSLHINKKIADQDLRKTAFKIVSKKDFQQFVQKVRAPHMHPDYYRWQYYKSHAHSIKQNTRLVFKVLDFQTQSKSLQDAIAFLKTHFSSNKAFNDYKFDQIPIEFIPSKMRRYIIAKNKEAKNAKTVDADCYEFMLYMHISKGIRKGDVTIKDSFTYKSLDDELIPKGEWESNKASILQSIKNQLISTDIEKILTHFEALIEEGYKTVNQKISSGNSKIKIKYNEKGEVLSWRMSYRKLDDMLSNPFYENMTFTDIAQILKFANHHTSFIKKFTHILPIYSKKVPDLASISACIVAKGTGNDIYKMKDICDLKEQELTSTHNNFIRHNTLVEASDTIINKVAKLPIFEKYTLTDYGIHASVDGQKLETRYNTIQARYSSKYYGLGKGVSAYTLFANCLPLCTKVIGANEHESYYLLDVLRNNTSNVEISSVSGDMHSINRVNFALLYMFGYRFMPRFTHLDQKANSLMISFDDPNSKHYQDYLIKPSKKANKALIIKEWDNILRILATLAIKKNTQANIIRKLSSYKSNDTLKALISLDKIIMTLYLLDYIEDEEMRKCVYRSLNRSESYNQLRAAIAKVSGRKLIGKTEIELVTNNECSRLLAICIIFYNASILSGIYEHCRSKGMSKECKNIIRLSPVAWQHISLIGKYEFKKDNPLLDLQELILQSLNNLQNIQLKGYS